MLATSTVQWRYATHVVVVVLRSTVKVLHNVPPSPPWCCQLLKWRPSFGWSFSCWVWKTTGWVQNGSRKKGCEWDALYDTTPSQWTFFKKRIGKRRRNRSTRGRRDIEWERERGMKRAVHLLNAGKNEKQRANKQNRVKRCVAHSSHSKVRCWQCFRPLWSTEREELIQKDLLVWKVTQQIPRRHVLLSTFNRLYDTKALFVSFKRKRTKRGSQRFPGLVYPSASLMLFPPTNAESSTHKIKKRRSTEVLTHNSLACSIWIYTTFFRPLKQPVSEFPFCIMKWAAQRELHERKKKSTVEGKGGEEGCMGRLHHVGKEKESDGTKEHWSPPAKETAKERHTLHSKQQQEERKQVPKRNHNSKRRSEKRQNNKHTICVREERERYRSAVSSHHCACRAFFLGGDDGDWRHTLLAWLRRYPWSTRCLYLGLEKEGNGGKKGGHKTRSESRKTIRAREATVEQKEEEEKILRLHCGSWEIVGPSRQQRRKENKAKPSVGSC